LKIAQLAAILLKQDREGLASATEQSLTVL
jgi:hypothetical protein